MSSIIKTIILLIVLAGIGYGVYFYFSKQNSTTAPVLNTASAPIVPVASTSSQNTTTSNSTTTTNPTMSEQDFLTILLSVRKINLNQEIFKEPAFGTLQNSTIELIPDGNEGRPNPFAPIGTDPIASTSNTSTSIDNITISNSSVNSSGGTSVDFVLPTQNTTVTPTTTPVITPNTQTPVSNITITPNKSN